MKVISNCLRLLLPTFILWAIIVPFITLPVQTQAADLTCDGIADDVQIQAALNALPSNGGRITLAAGTYNLAATVFRAIDNVIIEGAGESTVLNYNNSSAIFSAGSQSNWVFRNMKLDAGGVNVASARNWKEDTLTVGSTQISYQSSISFTATADSVYAMNASGSNDHTLISNAIAAGNNNIQLNPGTWDIGGALTVLSSTKIIGFGNATVLNFSNNATSQIVAEDASNVELGNFKITGTEKPTGGIFIEAQAGNVTNVYLHDIYNAATGGKDFHLYPNATGATGRAISNVEYVRCTAASPDGFGFVQTGEGTSPTLINVNYYRTAVVDAGVGANRTSVWVTAYDFNEVPTAILRNMTVIDASGDGAWESIFHFEAYAGITNAVLIQTTAIDGGNKPSPAWGAGYRLTTGVTVYAGNATNNKGYGFNVADGGTLVNCVASGNGAGNFANTKWQYSVNTTYTLSVSITNMAVDNIYIWKNLLETNDFLAIAVENVTASPPLPSPITDSFVFRFMSSNLTTEYASAQAYNYVNNGYGKGVVSWYFPASANMTWTGNYSVRIEGKISAFPDTIPYYNYTIPNTAWYTGTNSTSAIRSDLKAKVITDCNLLYAAWGGNTSLLESSDIGTVFSSYGQAYWDVAVPGLSVMCPDLYLVKITDPEPITGNWTTTAEATAWETKVSAGPFGNRVQSFADLFSVSYLTAAAIPVLVACVGLMIVGAFTGNILSGLMNAGAVVIPASYYGWFPPIAMFLIAFASGVYVLWHIFGKAHP